MPEQRMSAHLTRLAKKRGRLPALVTALSLGLLLALQQFLQSLIWFARSSAYPVQPSAESGLYELQAPAYSFEPSLDQVLFYILPLTLGVFLALWVIAPISHELTLRFVLTRAALASACGVVLVILFQLVHGLFGSIGASNYFGWDADGEPIAAPVGVNFAVFGQNSLDALSSGIGSFISVTPVVLLAGVLLWLWLRDHPREYAVSGLIDDI